MTNEQLQSMMISAAKQAVTEYVKRTSKPDDKELWTAKQVGEYLSVTERTILDSWSYKSWFPKSSVLGDGTNAPRRWFAKDVRAFAKNRQS